MQISNKSLLLLFDVFFMSLLVDEAFVVADPFDVPSLRAMPSALLHDRSLSTFNT